MVTVTNHHNTLQTLLVLVKCFCLDFSFAVLHTQVNSKFVLVPFGRGGVVVSAAVVLVLSVAEREYSQQSVSAEKTTTMNDPKATSATTATDPSSIHHGILIQLEECLFGPNSKCPKVGSGRKSLGSKKEDTANAGASDGDDDDDINNNTGGKEDIMDSATSSRYEDDDASQHDISMPQLRKICSQGIPDENSWRAVSWRVLLGYLPTNDIFRTWPETVHAQRSFYMTLVEQYLHVSPSNLNGRELRGHLSKTLRNRQLRKNYHTVASLDDSGRDLDDDNEEDLRKNFTTNTTSQNDNILEDDDEEEDLIDACIRRGGLQSLQKVSSPAAASSLPSSVEAETADVTEEEEAPLNDEQVDTDNDNQNHVDDGQNSSKEGPVYDSDGSLCDLDHSGHSHSQMDDDDGDDTGIFQSVTDQLPSRFREEWIASGMNSLDQRSSTSNGSFSVASIASINRLVVPQPLVEAAAKEALESDPHAITKREDETEPIEKESGDGNPTNGDYAASSSSSPSTPSLEEIFHTFLQDAQSLEQIRKDVVRTHQDLRFYLEPDRNLGVRRCAAIERVLYIWSKLNKGVNYVQGMNEIVGTLYYVLANDLNSDWSNAAEADTYYLFQTLLLEFQDVFMPELDDTSTGIQGRMANLERLLQTHDPSLQSHLHDVGIDASFYALRWLSTLLSREFLLPDTIRLWDSMFCSTHKENFLRYVCGTMVMMIREDLLKNDLAGCLRLLQSYPPTNMDEILEASKALWLYESQITLAVTKGGISLQQALNTIRPPPTIIFAFGLQGGVPPPTKTEVVQEKAQQTREKARQTAASAAARAEQATTRLFGRAKKVWNEWGSTSSHGNGATDLVNEKFPAVPDVPVASDITQTQSTGSDPSPNRPPPQNSAGLSLSFSSMKPRAWNRGRAESYGSASSSGTADGLSEQAGDAKVTNPSSESTTTRSSEVMSRLWNRRRFGSGNSSSAQSIQSSPPASTTNEIQNGDGVSD